MTSYLTDVDDLYDPTKVTLLPFNRRMEVVKGDITKQEVNAIINAAHEGLCGGGGVDGAIHKAAGSTMTGECINLPENLYGERCSVGDCRITGGYDLPANYIIHTVGPVWRGGEFSEKDDLRACYQNCINMAKAQGLKSIAFPCISSGAFAMPKDICASIAFQIVSHALANVPDKFPLSLVKFVCFDQENYDEYIKLMPNEYLEFNHSIVDDT